MPDPRLHVEDQLAAGARVALDEGQSRKLAQVLRLGLGAGVRLFNARDGEWRAEIAEKDKRGLALIVRAHLRAPTLTPDLDLLFAPLKRDATDLVVEKATELGVRRLRPVITARTIAETVRLDRMDLIARSAAEQSERFDIPETLAPVPLAKALDAWEEGRTLVWADETGDDPNQPWGGARRSARPIGALAHADAPAKLALLIGPEGGFTPEEARLLRAYPFVVPVGLGPRILRAETAAIAALAVLQSRRGDWRA